MSLTKDSPQICVNNIDSYFRKSPRLQRNPKKVTLSIANLEELGIQKTLAFLLSSNLKSIAKIFGGHDDPLEGMMNLWRDGIFTALNIKCSIRHAHLFFPCSLTNRFWSLLFALFDGDWVAFFSYLFFVDQVQKF